MSKVFLFLLHDTQHNTSVVVDTSNKLYMVPQSTEPGIKSDKSEEETTKKTHISASMKLSVSENENENERSFKKIPFLHLLLSSKLVSFRSFSRQTHRKKNIASKLLMLNMHSARSEYERRSFNFFYCLLS